MHEVNGVFSLVGFTLVLLAGSFFVVPLWASKQSSGPDQPQRVLAAVLLAALGLFTALLYLRVGTMEGLQSAPSVSKSDAPIVAEEQPDAQPDALSPTPVQIETMVNRLAQRLQSQPNDPAGWRMLARSFETLGRFDDAVKAYQRLLALQAPDPDLLTEYAVTLGMSKGQTLVGEPEVVIAQALKLNPRHIQALALAGSAAFEGRRYQQAIEQWQRLLSLVPADAPMRATIEGHIVKARGLLERDGATAASRVAP